MGLGARTLVELVESAATSSPQAVAFTYRPDGEQLGDQVTFAGFRARVRAAASSLQELHTMGERVVVLAEPGLGFATGFFACAFAGLVPVAAQSPTVGAPAAAAERLVGVARSCEIAGIVCDAPSEVLREPALRAGLSPTLPWHDLEVLGVDARDDLLPHSARPDELAFIQTTSGSTAAPKGVMLTHRNLLEQARLLEQATAQDPSCKSVTWAPLFHDLGLASAILLPLAVPYHSVLMSPFAFVQRPIRWLQAIHRERATLAGGPNFAYELLLRSVTVDQRAELDLSCWRLAFVGAEPIRPATVERFSTAFGPVGFRASSWFCCWGLAEATCVVTGRPAGSGARLAWFDQAGLDKGGRLVARPKGHAQAERHSGCGVALHGHDLLVVDPQQRVLLPVGSVGELWIRGPCVGDGYWGGVEPGAFRATLADGRGPYLRTGDLGALDADGELFVVGRLKDMLVVRGRNIAPQDLEATAERAHPDAEPGACAAFAIDDGAQERVVVLQGARRRGDAEVQEMQDAVRAALASEHGLQAEVVVVRASSIPRTASGKVRRSASREKYLTGALRPLDGEGRTR